MGHFQALLLFIHVEEERKSTVSCCVFHTVKCEGAEEGEKKAVKKLKCTALSKKAVEDERVTR